MNLPTLELDGKAYVVVSREEYDRLVRADRLPRLPVPDEQGNYPALAYARASLARKFILRREALGWSQAELARRAGMRSETLCRLETGKVSPNIATVEKLDKALTAAEQKAARSAGRAAKN